MSTPIVGTSASSPTSQIRHRKGPSHSLSAFPKLSSAGGSSSAPNSPSRLHSSDVKSPRTTTSSHKAPQPTFLGLYPAELDVLVFSTVVKLLLYPTYRSTDFEVHRNWLAITWSLPISKWYWDTTSEWTLDYPPFFAYFEFLLSIPARLIDKQIVDLNNLRYGSWSVVAYQRTTVVLAELVLGAALVRLGRRSIDGTTQKIIAFSLFMHPGFLIVDHIHFQYNGFLFGILVWSFIMAREGKPLASGALFAVLLNFKHIYMYLAPAYFVYLLRTFCFTSIRHASPTPTITEPSSIPMRSPINSSTSPTLVSSEHKFPSLSTPPPISITTSSTSSAPPPSLQFQLLNFISLANVVVAIFVLSFGPFVFLRVPSEYVNSTHVPLEGGVIKAKGSQIAQIFSRLFPFTRGLNHAYWAPNFWALVTLWDRVLLRAVRLLKLSWFVIRDEGVVSTSRGLVGDTIFAVLPTIKPFHTFMITMLFQLVFLVKLWLVPSYKSFLTAVTLCGWASFTFGWHVHEKAVLLVLVPLSLLAADSNAHLRTFIIASSAGIVSLFPLIFTPSETFFKMIYTVFWCSLVFPMLTKRVYEYPDTVLGAVIDRLERLYLCGLPVLQAFVIIYGGLPSPEADEITTAATFAHAKAAIENITAVASAALEVVEGCVPPEGILTAAGQAASCASPTSTLSAAIQTATASAATILNTTSSEAIKNHTSGGMEFLPLMLTSVYCAIGLLWAFGRLSWIYLIRTSGTSR